MYNSQKIANRIKSTSKSKGIIMKTMLAECELGINSVSQMSKGNDMLSKNLAKIADYLNVSVDYLLGRTDYPYTIQADENGKPVVMPDDEPPICTDD